MVLSKKIHDIFKPYDYPTSMAILEKHFTSTFPDGKKIYLFVGTNGAGKSTLIANLYKENLLNVPYLNADMLLRKSRAYYDRVTASKKTTEIAKQLINQGKSFCLETILTHPSKIELLQEAKENGYVVEATYVDTSSPQINIDRVEKRVKEGGHNVAPDKVIERYEKTKDVVCSLIPLCNEISFFDNSQDLTQNKLKNKKNLKVKTKKQNEGEPVCTL